MCLDFTSHDSWISKETSNYLTYTKNCFPGTFCTITDWTKPGTVVTSGEVNISALKQDHKPISFPACLSKLVLEVSSNEFLDNHSIFSTHLSTLLLGATETHYFLFYLQWNWGIHGGGGVFVRLFFLQQFFTVSKDPSPASSSLCWIT